MTFTHKKYIPIDGGIVSAPPRPGMTSGRGAGGRSDACDGDGGGGGGGCGAMWRGRQTAAMAWQDGGAQRSQNRSERKPVLSCTNIVT